jgi:hypothetical protein
MTYYEIGRDIYEAIVLCSFQILILNFVGSELHGTLVSKRRRRMTCPFCCGSISPNSSVIHPSVRVNLQVLFGDGKMVIKLVMKVD